MAQCKWGGLFLSRDPVARIPVRGSIGGEFVGEYPESQEQVLKATILSQLNELLAASRSSVLTSFADLPALGQHLTAALEGQLGTLGARGQVTVAFAKLDPMTEATLKARAKK